MRKSVRQLVALLVVGVLVGVLGAGCALGGVSKGHSVSKGQSHAAPSSHAVSRQDGTPAGTNGLQYTTMSYGGQQRTYLLYVPPGDSASTPLPLVLVYHGAGENAYVPAETTTNLVSMDMQNHNMILVFPQGYDDSWNDDAGEPPAERAGVNDVGFTTAILQSLESTYYVNMKEVVATGVSNGAILTELLGCRIAAYLTLIVPVEGQLAPKFSNSCRPADPISVYEVHGTADNVIPYKGGTFAGLGGPVTVLSAAASAARWAQIDDCKAKLPTQRPVGNVLTRYGACRDRVRVTLDTVQGGAHAWPDDFAGVLSAVMNSLTGSRRAVSLATG